MAMLATPLVLSGTLVYEKPAKIERHVRTPFDEKFSVNGDTLTIETRKQDQTRTLLLSSQPVLRAFVESIRATLAGDRATLTRFFRVRLDGSRAHWTLHLVPAGTDMASYVVVIRVSGSDNRISTIEVEETGGDRSLTNIKGEGS